MRYLILSAAFALGTCTARAQLAEPLLFAEKSHDFGKVIESNGEVAFQFRFTNLSPRPVRIISVQPSCGCTTPSWTQEAVMTGKQGFIEARFDPRGRPGYFSKTLSVLTDVSATPLVLEVKGDVVGDKPKNADRYTYRQGRLATKNSSLNLGRVYINQPPAVQFFEFYNDSDTVVSLQQVEAPDYLRVDGPAQWAPYETTVLKLTFDARKKNQFGFISENMALITDDREQPRKSYSVYATVEEYFAPVKPGFETAGPLLSVEENSIDLGRPRAGALVQHNLRIRNAGKKELLLRDVQSNCTCMTVRVPQKALKPGEESILAIEFDTRGRSATQQKSFIIYSTDPINPVQRVVVSLYIEG